MFCRLRSPYSVQKFQRMHALSGSSFFDCPTRSVQNQASYCIRLAKFTSKAKRRCQVHSIPNVPPLIDAKRVNARYCHARRQKLKGQRHQKPQFVRKRQLRKYQKSSIFQNSPEKSPKISLSRHCLRRCLW